MKKILLVTILVSSLTSFSQNQAPVAVDDTIYFTYGDIHVNDSAKITKSFKFNDYDPDGNSIQIDSIIYTGQNSIIPFYNNGTLWWLDYIVSPTYSGSEDFEYIISDNGSPIKYDTGTVTVVVMRKAYEVLEANNISANIDKDVLFSGPTHTKPGFEVPKGSGRSTIFATNIWISGLNNGSVFSNIRDFGAQAYGPGYTSNCGPVSNNSHTDSLFNTDWDRVWKVYQHQIDFHINNWNDPGYTLIQDIADWPAHGDTVLGEAFYLAPFYDHNNDGLYNPLNGDYPIIKGDQAIYFIYNDGNSPISVNPMISEVHGMAYAYQCMDSALRNTIFVDYKIYNRSNNTYDSTYFGMWSDMDLGNAQDDYVQCDVDRGLFFMFNGDDFDDDNQGIPGYGAHPAAQAVVILKGAKQDDDGQDNAFGISTSETINGTGFGDGITDNEYWGMSYFGFLYNSVVWNPNIESDFYYLLSGRGFSGVPWAHDFLNTGNLIPFRFVFPGSSDTNFYGTGGITVPDWSEGNQGNVPADKRVIGSTGPVTFAPGDAIELTYAFVFGRDYVNIGAQAGVANMLMRSDSIRSYYNQGMLAPCGNPVSVNKLEEAKSTIKVFPNPVDNVVNIRQQSASLITITIIDATGKVMRTSTSNSLITTINLQGLANGLYLIKVSNADGVEFKKMIKR